MKLIKFHFTPLNSLKSLLVLILTGLLFIYIIFVLRTVRGADLPGDIDGNGRVDIADLEILGRVYGTTPGHPLYNPAADLWPDSRINSADLFILAQNYGRTSGSPTSTPRISPAVSPSPQPTQPANFLRAFPGAEGFGAKSKGGRGGTVHRVTNLNNSGAGSLRACVEASGPRYCIFDISGTINLSGNKITVDDPFITIAGQSAPSPGITVRGGTFQIRTNDVIIRHIRFRYGDSPCKQDDTLQFHTASARNIIADHVSVSWGVDENVNTYQNPQDVTLSNSIVAEALNNSCHSEGPHSKGFLIQDPSTNISLLRSLFMHNADRNAYAKDQTSSIMVNNVFYNTAANSWSRGFATKLGSGDGGTVISSVVGNVYIEAANSNSKDAINIDGSMSNASRIQLSDNLVYGMIPLENNKGSAVLVNSPPVWPQLITVMSASTVESYLKTHAGARPKDRDAVDQRLVSELSARGGKIINSQTEVGGWPNLAVNQRVFPVPSNPNGDDNNNGYTNLEELLHQYAAALE